MPSSTSIRTRRFEGSPLGLVAGRFVPLHSFKTTENVNRSHFPTKNTIELELTTSRDPKIDKSEEIGRVFVFFRDYTLTFDECVVRNVQWAARGPYEVSMVARDMVTVPR